MLLPTYTPKSAKSTTTKVSDAIFAGKVNQTLVAQAVRVYLSNQRQGTKHAKTRGEVAGTGKKIYRQKGTGKARHGDRLAPIFVKGGVAHGPKGNENYRKALPRALSRQSLISALSSKAKNKQVIIVDNVSSIAKTKTIHEFLTKILKDSRNIILVTENAHSPVVRASKNLALVSPITASQVTTYDIVKHDTIVLTTESLPILEKRIQN